ncbi:unnamed protein product [Phytophthora fragariaefolia]|uniref:Unnamed protein product n=1 Tax=Phytophthora fragariaefolia TaxID=1490495 RepID=A0A9W6YML8_9STRA|nr:unnamed protein product [Phytophthora fragariaefolia]
MEVEAKTAALQGSSAEGSGTSVDGSVCRSDGEQLAGNEPVDGSPQGARDATAKVLILSVNDVYELLPDTNGVGGVAELATMLRATRQKISRDTHVIVTLNGDFLWRSELDRKDKGCGELEEVGGQS